MDLASTRPNKVTYATYFGGAGDDWGYGIATDTGNHAFVTGATESAVFPTSIGAYDAQLDGANDAFVAKLLMTQKEYRLFLPLLRHGGYRLLLPLLRRDG